MLMPLFLYGMVKTQAVGPSGPEAAESGEGCFGVWEQMQLHGRVRTDHNCTVADAQVDPVAGDTELLGDLGHGQPAWEAAAMRWSLQNPMAQADGPDGVDQNLTVPR